MNKLKDLELEINRLMKLKRDIEHIKAIQQQNPDIVFMSQRAYNELPKPLKRANIIYYILDKEIGHFIDGFIY